MRVCSIYGPSKFNISADSDEEHDFQFSPPVYVKRIRNVDEYNKFARYSFKREFSECNVVALSPVAFDTV